MLLLGDLSPTVASNPLFKEKNMEALFRDAIRLFEGNDYTMVTSSVRLPYPSCVFCTYDASIMAMCHCPRNYIPHIRKYFNMGDLSGLIAPHKLMNK